MNSVLIALLNVVFIIFDIMFDKNRSIALMCFWMSISLFTSVYSVLVFVLGGKLILF